MSIFSTSGFSLAYYLFTFFAIEAAFFVALGHWRRNLSLKARRLAIAFGVLGALRFLFLLIFAFQAIASKILLEEALAVFSMGVLTWGFSPFFARSEKSAIFVIANSLLTLGLFSLSLIIPFNGLSVIFLLWQIGLGIFLLTTMLREFTQEQLLTIIGIAALTVGAALQLALGNSLASTANTATFIRLAEMIAYPILVIATYQEVIEALNLQSVALKNLSQTSQEEIKGLISLFEATKDITSSLSLPEVVDGAAKGVVSALNVDQCAIALPEDGDPSLLRMVATYNPRREGRGEAITFPVNEQQAIKHSLERLRQVELNDSYDSPQIKFLFAMMGARDQTGPLIFQPIVLNEKPLGILIVGNAYSKRPFSPTEAQLIKTMARQIAIAIDNARSYHTLTTKSQQLAWTLRNSEQSAERRTAALEAELKKSREEVIMISQRLYEQETLARKSQKDLTEYQKHTEQTSRQLRATHKTLEELTHENQQLSSLTASHKKQLEKLQQTEKEMQALKDKVNELHLEAAEAEKFKQALEAAQDRSRKLTKALRINRAKLQQLASMPVAMTSPQVGTELENLACGVLVSDANGYISRVNKASVQLFGLATNELMGKKLSDIDSTQKWLNALQKITEESLVSTTLTINDQIIKATISPITDPENGQSSGNVIILYDATEEFETQQARDEFVASLAQELRTPMTSIIGYIELLLGESVGMIGDMQRKFLQRAKANVERMDGLLNDLIGVAAIDAGQLEITPASIDMAEIIEDVILGAKAQLEEKEIKLKLNLPDEIPPVEADPNSMHQIMANLLNNAVKSTPSGGGIEVKATVIQHDNLGVDASGAGIDERWFKVSITDSGGGIAEKDIDRVFDRFYKAEHPLVQGLGETGVGLSIVKYLIEAHKGEVWFDTEMGQGTTFHFVLPVKDYYNDPWDEIDIPPFDFNSDVQDY